MKWLVITWAIWIVSIALYQLHGANQEAYIQSAAQQDGIEVITDAPTAKMDWTQEEITWLKDNGMLEHALALSAEHGALLREMIQLSMRDELFEKVLLDSLAKYYPETDPGKFLVLPDRSVVDQLSKDTN